MFPALAALGFGALGVGSLIKQIYQANTDPDPKDIEKVIDDKAINISRQNGIPVDLVKQQIREDTIKEMKADREFNWGDAAFNALSIVPGGMVAKGLGAAAKAGGLAGGKAALSEMTGLGGAIGKRTAKTAEKAAESVPQGRIPKVGEGVRRNPNEFDAMGNPLPGAEPLAKTGPAAKQAGATVKESTNPTPYSIPLQTNTVRPQNATVYKPGAREVIDEDAAEMATPAMRAAHGAEEVGEYGGGVLLLGYTPPPAAVGTAASRADMFGVMGEAMGREMRRGADVRESIAAATQGQIGRAARGRAQAMEANAIRRGLKAEEIGEYGAGVQSADEMFARALEKSRREQELLSVFGQRDIGVNKAQREQQLLSAFAPR